ncbi:hypothetical protein PoB_001975500 [Plakobranchus ocellatus]|uniref:Uncharacterized protein n=1 Tax=Plakobranchus ocellatus TaxID=259542 RepID=A0AAV3ZF87_9GAST|nr:hypothetical protein PoB_001975500 [Plakobranchus ocellatus]
MSGAGQASQIPCEKVSDSNCLSNGEQGREPPKIHPNAKEDLNFGWFSLSRDEQKNGMSISFKLMCIDPGSRPASVRGRTQNGNRPESHDGKNQQQDSSSVTEHKQNGGLAPTAEAELPPSSRQGQYPQQQQCRKQPGSSKPEDIQRLVVSDDPDMAEFEQVDQEQQASCGQMQDMLRNQGDGTIGQRFPPEVDTVDWPLSRAAKEMIMRQAHPPAEPSLTFGDKQCRSRPGSQCCTSQVPPTPMPPLTWNGYKGNSRPTYASWREQWHRAHSQPSSHAHCPQEFREGNFRSTNSENFHDFSNYNYSRSNNIYQNNHNNNNNNYNNNRITLSNNINTDNNSECEDNISYGINGSDKYKGRRCSSFINIKQTVPSGEKLIGDFHGGSMYRAAETVNTAGNNINDYARCSAFETGIGQNRPIVFDATNNCNGMMTRNYLHLTWCKNVRKQADYVVTFIYPSVDGTRVDKSDVELRREDIYSMNSDSIQCGGSTHQKNSLVEKLMSRVQAFRDTAFSWSQKVLGKPSTHGNYWHFENDN